MESPAVDVQAIMHDIRHRLRAKRRQDAELYSEADKIVSSALALSLRNLESQLRELRTDVERIGGLPPAPPTLRGRVGALLVALMRRSLFWLIPSLQMMQIKVVSALDENRRAVRELTVGLRQLNAELIALKRSPADASFTGDAEPAPGDNDRPAATDPAVAALIEELEETLTAQLRIQRELFHCLASERSRSLSASRKSE
jgi:hypothetical protein